MSQKPSGNPLAHTFKTLIVMLFKLLAITIAFALRIVSLLFSKISELLEKSTGHDKHH
jgi:hypothetical protein